MVRHLRLVLGGVGMVAAAVFAPIVRGQQGSGLPVAQQFEQLHFRSIGPAMHVGPHHRLRCVRGESGHLLRRRSAHGGVWKTTNDGATFTPQFQDERPDVDRRRRRVADESRPRVGRHRRRQQPPEHVVGRRHLQVDRRRQDVPAHGPRAARSTSSASSSIRTNNNVVLVAAHGSALRARRRSRRLQDHRRRHAPGSRCSRSTTTRARTIS